MKDFSKEILKSCGFHDAVNNVENGKCAWCGSDKIKPEDFKDALSLKEFGISGFCQKCQDETFG